jgi:ketosteroid isomerase-like protein
MRQRMGWVLVFRDGRVTLMRFYGQHGEALEAVGVR